MAVTGTITKTVNISHTADDTISVVTDSIVSGSNTFPSLTRTVTDGTAAGQANKVYRIYGTINASSSSTIDLSGSLTNFHGDAVVFTGVKYLCLAIVSPDGTKKLQIGNAASNSFQGPLSGTTTTQDCFYSLEWENWSAAGWSVTNSSNDNLKLNNPGASAVSYCMTIVGI